MLKTILNLSGGVLKNKIHVASYSCSAGKKVAVILSGCGVYDGSEIHEAAATVVHLTRHNLEPVFYAPEIAQMHVINHIKGEPTCEVRCVMTESARIARGAVKPLSSLKTTDADALIFPGGFGAAKNLSSFATMGTDCTVNVEVCRVIQDFHHCKMPMAFMCISPILAARIIPGVKITLGRDEKRTPTKWPHAEAIGAAKRMGAKVELKNVSDVCVDQENMVLSTPAFMYDGQFCEIFDGIGNLVDHLECLLKS